MKIIIIAAISENYVIGRNGKIPWHSPEDLKLFKDTTLNFPIVMGRKTFESIGKILPDRLNIVISSRKPSIQSDTLLFFNSIEKGISFLKRRFEKCFIIGGEQIYKESFELAEELFISHFHIICEGDRFFSKIDKMKWVSFYEKKYEDFTHSKYKRKN